MNQKDKEKSNEAILLAIIKAGLLGFLGFLITIAVTLHIFDFSETASNIIAIIAFIFVGSFSVSNEANQSNERFSFYTVLALGLFLPLFLSLIVFLSQINFFLGLIILVPIYLAQLYFYFTRNKG